MRKTGDIIKELRKMYGLTQKELSDEINCSLRTISRYEANQSLIETHNLIKLALYFELPTDILLGLSSFDDNEHIIYLKSIVKKSKSNKPIEGERYYWIFKNEKEIGGNTQFKRFTSDMSKEIRGLRYVDPIKSIELCTEYYEPPMVINSEEEAIAFSVYGGQAIVKESICRKCLCEFLEDLVVIL